MGNFGERLKVLRESKGKYQGDVAKGIGVQQTRISYLEKQEEVPKESTVRALAEYFNVPIMYFFGEEEANPNEDDFAHLRKLREEPKEDTLFTHIMQGLDDLDENAQEQVKNLVESLRKKEIS
ncbi:MAG TPA: helix-turn-helix transcriptional regulator [Bacteroidales bacterium]|nr:helix-turn-helix transcriptional regulator [Bacteroidales bacterium]